MTCANCGEEELYEHRDGQMLRGYCPRCGSIHEIRREELRERWTDEKRAAHGRLTKQGFPDLSAPPQRKNKRR